MTTERLNFLEERRKGIGGSDVSSILGLNKWRSAYDVWLDKLGRGRPSPDNNAMFWGRTLEPIIREIYSETTGREVIFPNRMLSHPQHPFMVANLDGYTTDKRVLEIKTARSDARWGEEGTDNVPFEYLLQVQHYLLVTGFEVADIAVLIAGQDFRIYEVKADDEIHELLITREAEFWHLVETETPPQPQSYADIQAIFGSRSTAGEVTASKEAENAIRRLRELRDVIVKLNEEEEVLKAIIMKEIGEKDTLVNLSGTPLATWKLAKGRKTFDSKSFQAEHPKLYDQYSKTAEAARRFLIK